MFFRQLFDRESCTYTYLLADRESREAVLVDSVRELVERDAQLVRELDLTLLWVLETHVHADHVTGATALKERLGCRSAMSQGGNCDCADRLLGDGDRVQFGRYWLEVRATPGHTDSCVTYVTGDQSRALSGDALFVRGCGRTDFQQGDARKLYRSVWGRILSLPDSTLVYPGHDYNGRTVTTVGEEKRWNPRLGAGRTEEDFVAIMTALKLAPPAKIHEAVPANLNCGVAPPPLPPEQRHEAR
jgi:glyoxylase-like metal-dependent hydrolase (beta-lactamase superfamily II)